jgi:hypothetical protein
MKTGFHPGVRLFGFGVLLVILWGGGAIGMAADENRPALSPDDFKFDRVSRVPSQKETLAVPDPKLEDRRARQDYNLRQTIVMGITLVLSLFTVSVFVSKKSDSAAHLVNACALTLIVFGTIYVTILADTDQQLTASTGILGAVAGYLFGSMRRSGNDGPPTPEKPSGSGSGGAIIL